MEGENDEMAIFKRSLRRYLDMHKEEERYKAELKTIKEEKDKAENQLLQFIETHDYQDRDIVVGDYKVKYAQTKQQEGITKKLLYDRFMTYFRNDEEKAKELLDLVYSERNVSVKTSLKTTLK